MFNEKRKNLIPREHNIGDEIVPGSSYKNIMAIEIFDVKNRNNERYVICYCKCGNIFRFSYSNFKKHNNGSCGCLPRGFKHGFSRSKIYDVWKNMNYRCNRENDCNYHKYGEKGIIVCEEWSEHNENGFVNFKDWAYKNGYIEGMTVDRIDELKDYSPNNCRIATYLEQNTHLGMLKTNKSGYKGIWYNKDTNKYRVTISINNKSHNLGEYKTKREAVEIRNKYIDENNLLHKKQEYIGEDGYVNGKSY